MMMELEQECQRQANEYARHREELLDYYTLWVHQIKTPIAAMRLLMQSEEQSDALLEMELFKIEQYVEMVLGYLRCESMSSDLSFREYDLDGWFARQFENIRSCLSCSGLLWSMNP